MGQNDVDRESETQTTWQRRVASFRDALRAGWRDYRLGPWLFERAGCSEPVASAVQAFGGTDLFPSQWFSEERSLPMDGMGREWGTSPETRPARFWRNWPSAAPWSPRAIPSPINSIVCWSASPAAVWKWSRSSHRRVLRALQLERDTDLNWLPGAGARGLLRGTFSGAPVFSPQQAGATDLWVVDFDRIGTWQYVGGFDELATSAELLRDRFVLLDGSPVPATRITAEEFFVVAVENASAARGIRIPLEPAN